MGLGKSDQGGERGRTEDQGVRESDNSHKDPIPGPGKILKDLNSDVAGIDAVKKATVGEGLSQLELWVGRGVGQMWGEGDAYLTP
jgi:hypothetical protein